MTMMVRKLRIKKCVMVLLCASCCSWMLLHTNLLSSVLHGSQLSQPVINRSILEVTSETAYTSRPHGNVTPTHVYEFAETSRPLITNSTVSGYQLATDVRQRCGNPPRYNPSVSVNQKYTVNPLLQFCPIWKVATTTLKRLFVIKNTKGYSKQIDPYNISFLLPYNERVRTMYNDDRHVRVMFVRNPYDRLFSGYVDKMMAPNPTYWDIIGVPAIKAVRPNPSAISAKCGHDLTFAEYVDYATRALGFRPEPETLPHPKKAAYKHDGHYDVMSELCRTCIVKYDFIGKIETFGRDVYELLKYMDMPKTAVLLSKNGSRLATEDAIRDTTFQPFDKTFFKGFKKCNISIKDTLERAWHKLQIRGLIGRQKLDISNELATTITYRKFLAMAMTAHKQSNKAERHELKHEYYRSQYLSVDKPIRDRLKKVYANDFRLFDYSDELNLD